MTVATIIKSPVSFKLLSKKPSQVSPITPERFMIDTKRA